MKCEKCGKEHDGSYGSGRFCSKHCARGFSSSNRTIESRQKTAISVSKEHIHICPKCKKTFLNKGTAPNALCAKCKAQKYSNIRVSIITKHIEKYCKYCGATYGQCKRPEICKHFRLFPKMIALFHMDKNVFGSEELYQEYDRISNELNDLYWNKGKTIQEIKDLVHYKSSTGSFANFLCKFVKFRNISQAINLAIKNGKMKPATITNMQFKTGFHTTWNNKVYFYRSSYEEDFCKELDNQKIDYEIETLQIKYFDSQCMKDRFAFPDFYIPTKNLIVEVKSAFTLDKQNMYDKFLAYKELGYNVDLLLEHVHYYNMAFFE